jgi:hypothetical protein
MLGDGEPEIAEGAEDSPFGSDAEDEKEEDWVPDVPEEKEEQEDRSLLRDSSDPVRMYLQEMGGVALLSREDEVVIAKSIETGELEVRKAVFSLPLALQYVLNLADRLRDGEIDGRHLFGDEENEEPANAEGAPEREDARVTAFLKHIARLRRLVNEREKLVEAGLLSWIGLVSMVAWYRLVELFHCSFQVWNRYPPRNFSEAYHGTQASRALTVGA